MVKDNKCTTNSNCTNKFCNTIFLTEKTFQICVGVLLGDASIQTKKILVGI